MSRIIQLDYHGRVYCRRSDRRLSPLFAGVILCLATGDVSAQQPSASLQQADTDYRAGVAALAKNDVTTARTDFERVVHLAPQAEQGHSALGAVLVRMGDMTRGIRELEKALAMKPSDQVAQLNLAMAYTQTGAFDKALPLFAKLDTSSNGGNTALSSASLAMYARALAPTHPDAAIRKMQAALKSAPDNADLQDELGSLYAQQARWPQAEQCFHRAIDLNENLASAHLHLGIVLDRQHESGAIEEMQRASQLAPDNLEVMIEFGTLLVASGQLPQAIEVLHHAASVHPDSEAATYQLALALQQTGDTQAAIPLFEKVVAAEPGNAAALTNLGMACLQQQKAKDAIPYLQKAIQLDPKRVTAHQNLAAAYIQLNQVDDAIEQLRAALKLAPDMPALHYNLGLAYKMQDNAALAIPELETAEKLDPSAHEAPYVLGVLYMQTARYEEAARELDRSLHLQPRNGDGWATLGSVDARLDRLPEAASALNQAIEQSPDQPDPHLTLATVLAKQGHTAEAASERKRAAELMRANMNRQRAEVATNSANSLLQGGKVDDAIAQFKDALGYDGQYAAAHRGLAEAFDRKGDSKEAALHRQQADALEKAAPQ